MTAPRVARDSGLLPAPGDPEVVVRLIDSHAHIGEDSFDEDRAAMLRRARRAGVEAVGVIGYNVESSRKVIGVVDAAPVAPTEDSPALFATAGFAPHNVAEADAESKARSTQHVAEATAGNCRRLFRLDPPVSE